MLIVLLCFIKCICLLLCPFHQSTSLYVWCRWQINDSDSCEALRFLKNQEINLAFMSLKCLITWAIKNKYLNFFPWKKSVNRKSPIFYFENPTVWEHPDVFSEHKVKTHLLLARSEAPRIHRGGLLSPLTPSGKKLLLLSYLFLSSGAGFSASSFFFLHGNLFFHFVLINYLIWVRGMPTATVPSSSSSSTAGGPSGQAGRPGSNQHT